ncbi:MAG: hypothetical protein ACP5JX_04050, partial [Sulfurihydrogenibium sp.]
MKKFMLLTLISTSAFAVDVKDIPLDVNDKEKEILKEVFKNDTKDKDESLSKKKQEDKNKNLTIVVNKLLKLLVQTFLGNKDLENAYEVSKKALELFP